ncbi:diaminopimelate decarboxylase [Thermodesulfovibrio aggregans]|uniref:Diaminopimelate decarboxylase n=1 Tax=Thermodesulfovibrio aggregans TaxID=86166 RepID=A0A0U9HLY7_9BACT|nr:diaminopimelate decarboxylase [Thermodesulfovibrio aggregans]GAQ94027.1 diaminopimelate decarboxylase [Thermodesulfovibrio aggregans]
MHFFSYKNGDLYAEDVPVKELIKEFGTPLYIYSYGTLIRHIRAYEEAFCEVPHIICYAVKANSNLAILSLFAQLGIGADIVSGGELFRALKAGIKPFRIVFAGVGKSEEEIEYALKNNILMFNVESEAELYKINEIAKKLKKQARVALRVNPDIDPKTHKYIATGLKTSKFGIPIGKALEYYKLAKSLENVKVIGIHKHIGSQITEINAYVEALKKLLELYERLVQADVDIEYIDIGGGLGITYKDEEPPHPKELANALIPLIKNQKGKLIVEPGRSIVGNAGILVTKVLYIKETDIKNFIVVDAGMNDLIRPTLYGSYHEIMPVTHGKRKKITADIVGPICESGDFLAKDREIEKVSAGEYLAVMSAGAYGFSMSSNYNSRPRAAEVLVKGDRFSLIRKRETYKDLIRNEIIPEDLL